MQNMRVVKQLDSPNWHNTTVTAVPLTLPTHMYTAPHKSFNVDLGHAVDHSCSAALLLLETLPGCSTHADACGFCLHILARLVADECALSG